MKPCFLAASLFFSNLPIQLLLPTLSWNSCCKGQASFWVAYPTWIIFGINHHWFWKANVKLSLSFLDPQSHGSLSKVLLTPFLFCFRSPFSVYVRSVCIHEISSWSPFYFCWNFHSFFRISVVTKAFSTELLSDSLHNLYTSQQCKVLSKINCITIPQSHINIHGGGDTSCFCSYSFPVDIKANPGTSADSTLTERTNVRNCSVTAVST